MQGRDARAESRLSGCDDIIEANRYLIATWAKVVFSSIVMEYCVFEHCMRPTRFTESFDAKAFKTSPLMRERDL